MNYYDILWFSFIYNTKARRNSNTEYYKVIWTWRVFSTHQALEHDAFITRLLSWEKCSSTTTTTNSSWAIHPRGVCAVDVETTTDSSLGIHRYFFRLFNLTERTGHKTQRPIETSQFQFNALHLACQHASHKHSILNTEQNAPLLENILKIAFHAS